MSAGIWLDTNVPSETLRPMPNPSVTGWVEAHSDVQFVSVVSIGELRRGATLLVQGPVRRLQLEHYIEIKIPLLFGTRILPITQPMAERWGVLDARRQVAGQPLGIADGMIAATAIEHDLMLVTAMWSICGPRCYDLQPVGDVSPPARTVSDLFCSRRGRLPKIRSAKFTARHASSPLLPFSCPDSGERSDNDGYTKVESTPLAQGHPCSGATRAMLLSSEYDDFAR
jgi:predicted nucleic acid-binding protein